MSWLPQLLRELLQQFIIARVSIIVFKFKHNVLFFSCNVSIISLIGVIIKKTKVSIFFVKILNEILLTSHVKISTFLKDLKIALCPMYKVDKPLKQKNFTLTNMKYQS